MSRKHDPDRERHPDADRRATRYDVGNEHICRKFPMIEADGRSFSHGFGVGMDISGMPYGFLTNGTMVFSQREATRAAAAIRGMSVGFASFDEATKAFEEWAGLTTPTATTMAELDVDANGNKKPPKDRPRWSSPYGPPPKNKGRNRGR